MVKKESLMTNKQHLGELEDTQDPEDLVPPTFDTESQDDDATEEDN